jgi:hypothetical protein
MSLKMPMTHLDHRVCAFDGKEKPQPGDSFLGCG